MSAAGILIDTCVWVDHFARGSPSVAAALASQPVLVHEFILGELILGALPRNHPAANHLAELPRLPTLAHGEVVEFVRRSRLEGSGIGWTDAHLLASAKVSGTELWTSDRSLRNAAARCGVSLSP